MAGGKEPIEVKFRLFDGTDIGPSKYDPSTTVAALKEFVLSRWPQGLPPEIGRLNLTACNLISPCPQAQFDCLQSYLTVSTDDHHFLVVLSDF